MNLTNFMTIHLLKMFNTGQITLPKKWRSKFKTENFIAEEKEEGLLIKPILPDEDVILYEDEKEVGLFFPKGIAPQVLISKIQEIDG